MAKKVKNINGTSDTTCKCGSWLKHWENFSKQKAGLCSQITCTKSATVGAHVQKADSSDNKWYIIPLCADHNVLRNQEISIMDSTILVLANKSETCDKKN
jgi:hypothetical protein